MKKREQELQKLNLYALTAQTIALAMFNPETKAGKVFFQSNKQEHFFSEDDKIEFTAGDERTLLSGFWEAIQHYDRFITFNGRSFDCPFLCCARQFYVFLPPQFDALPIFDDRTLRLARSIDVLRPRFGNLIWTFIARHSILKVQKAKALPDLISVLLSRRPFSRDCRLLFR